MAEQLVCEITGVEVNEETGYSNFGGHIVSEAAVEELGLNTLEKIQEYFPDYQG